MVCFPPGSQQGQPTSRALPKGFLRCQSTPGSEKACLTRQHDPLRYFALDQSDVSVARIHKRAQAPVTNHMNLSDDFSSQLTEEEFQLALANALRYFPAEQVRIYSRRLVESLPTSRNCDS